MRPGGGKGKGNAFERDVCRDLSAACSNGERDDIFWRSATSGGRATQLAKKGKQNLTQHGDISAVDPLGAWLIDQYVIECKFYRDLQMTQLLARGAGVLAEFYVKLRKQSRALGRQPVLIAKQNQYPPMVFTSRNGLWTDDSVRAELLVRGSWIKVLEYKLFLEDVQRASTGNI